MSTNLIDQTSGVNSWLSSTYDPRATLDRIDGHICQGCRLIWIGGYRPDELDESTVGNSVSDNAEAFIQSLKALTAVDERDHGYGYADCLVCDEVIIDGHQAQAHIVP